MLFVAVAMLPLPLALWQVPPLDALQVQVQAESPAGNVSLTPTPLTATLAGFVTVIVYVGVSPAAIEVTPSLFVSARSERATIVSGIGRAVVRGVAVARVADRGDVHERARWPSSTACSSRCRSACHSC
jgi:hypothetical protein